MIIKKRIKKEKKIRVRFLKPDPYFSLKKLLRTNKPDFVIPYPKGSGLYHLSTPTVTNGMYLPTPPDYPAITAAQLSEQLSSNESRCMWHFNPRGLPVLLLPVRTVRSYRTISPLPRPKGQGGMFLWHFPSSDCSESHPLGGVALYVVRTFLIPDQRSGPR